MSDADFPCRVDIRSPQQLRENARRLFAREFSRDFREDLLGIAWIYHTAALFGRDPDVFLEKLEPDASPYMSKLIRNFLARSVEEKAMEKWRMYIADSEKGKYVEFRA